VSNLAEADPPDAATPHAPRLMRRRSGAQRVTNIELFFDLVYVYAITQLSHYLLGHPTVWAYMTWVTNWLDPQQMAVRLLLVVTGCGSTSSASWPGAWRAVRWRWAAASRTAWPGNCSGWARCAWT
jgi:hypothetical protein